MKNNIKTILLDIGNVILDVNFETFSSQIAEHSKKSKQHIFEKYCEGKIKQKLDKGLITPFEFFGRMKEEASISLSIKEIKAAWVNIFTLREDFPDAILELAKHFQVWIMSDTDPVHFLYFLNHFDLIRNRNRNRFILSYARGKLKNEAEAFSSIPDDFGCHLKECLLIDDKKENCKTAQNCGVDCIIFTNWNSCLKKLK